MNGESAGKEVRERISNKISGRVVNDELIDDIHATLDEAIKEGLVLKYEMKPERDKIKYGFDALRLTFYCNNFVGMLFNYFKGEDEYCDITTCYLNIDLHR